jgi:hypothetical protein
LKICGAVNRAASPQQGDRHMNGFHDGLKPGKKVVETRDNFRAVRQNQP